jgi:hypothetical protein
MAHSMKPPTQRTISASLRKYAVWLTALPVLAASFAQAQSLDVKIWTGSTLSGGWALPVINTGSGYVVNNVNYNPGGAVSIFCHDMTVGFDPFISASVDVINNTASVQNYTLIFTLPISAITGGTRFGGSTQGGLSDANFDGIGTLSTVGAGSSLFSGQIDGVDVLSLFGNPKVISVPFMGGSASDSTSAGLPGTTISGPLNALTTIGIKQTFSLTPGDRATFTSFFVVEPVPEPAALSLLAIGGLMVLARRRR